MPLVRSQQVERCGHLVGIGGRERADQDLEGLQVESRHLDRRVLPEGAQPPAKVFDVGRAQPDDRPEQRASQTRDPEGEGAARRAGAERREQREGGDGLPAPLAERGSEPPQLAAKPIRERQEQDLAAGAVQRRSEQVVHRLQGEDRRQPTEQRHASCAEREQAR